MNKILTAVAGAAVAAAALAGCSTASMSKAPAAAPSSSDVAGAVADTAAASPSASPTANLTGPVGTQYTDTGTDDSGNGGSFEYGVTLTQLIQHGQLGQYESLSNAGDHIAVAKLSIAGMSGVSHDDVNTLAIAIGSDGQEYQPSFDQVTEGTNFDSGDFTVTAKETVRGVVAFELPPGVTVASVQWQPSGLGTQAPATWTIS